MSLSAITCSGKISEQYASSRTSNLKKINTNTDRNPCKETKSNLKTEHVHSTSQSLIPTTWVSTGICFATLLNQEPNLYSQGYCSITCRTNFKDVDRYRSPPCVSMLAKQATWWTPWRLYFSGSQGTASYEYLQTRSIGTRPMSCPKQTGTCVQGIFLIPSSWQFLTQLKVNIGGNGCPATIGDRRIIDSRPTRDIPPLSK